jgi:hypothetical protein
MSYLENVISLLKVAFGTNATVYRDFVPEKTTKPSVVANEISNTSSRVLSGTKYGPVAVWRVSVYVTEGQELKPLLEILESLDNTSNTDFQKIYSNYVLTEAKQPNQTKTRAFYDLNLYK